jgi:hypothetical protein
MGSTMSPVCCQQLAEVQASSAPQLETVNVLYRAAVSAALLLQPLSAAELHELPTNNESEVPARNVVVCFFELAPHTWAVLTFQTT